VLSFEFFGMPLYNPAVVKRVCATGARKMQLTDLDRERYKRQIMMAGFGEESQTALKNATALVTRIGGLGGPAALYLAVAGIGKLILAHGGKMTQSNLNRQILMNHIGVGGDRIPHAIETIHRMNPECEVEGISENADNEKAAEWVARADVVISAAPSFEERYALNRACFKQGKPMIEAAMNDMEAYLTTYIPGRTPCLECLVPEPPPDWKILGFGVLGALSGSLGALATIEAVKVITGFGRPLAGEMIAYDAKTMDFRKLKIYQRPDCPVCGKGSQHA